MRKVVVISLLVALLIGVGAHADSLPLATLLDANVQFERFYSYTMDEASGEWAAHGLLSEHLLNTVVQNETGNYMENGICIMYPEVRGNRDLSLMEPILNVYLLRNSSIKANALSIITGGVRYDFVGQASEAAIREQRNRRGEQFILPLNGDGIAMLQSFAKSGGEVFIYGESRIFQTKITEADSSTSNRSRVEALSVAAVRDFLTLWPDNYALWDLNSIYWADERAEMDVVPLNSKQYPEGLPALNSSSLCLDTQNGAAVKQYQQMLKDNLFFIGNTATNYGKETIASTKKAQQYYGLLATGMADRRLIERLSGIEYPDNELVEPSPTEYLLDGEQKTNAGVVYAINEQMFIQLNRAWIAYNYTPSCSSSVTDRIFPTDRSNRLYIADGEIINLSDQTMQLPYVMQGYVRINSVRYPCTIQCEKDSGSAFGSSLLPMGKSRLVIVCEIPESIKFEMCELNLEIQCDSQTVEMHFYEQN